MVLSKKHYNLSIIVGAFLFLLGIYFHSLEDYAFYRLIRGVVCFSFLVLLFSYHKTRLPLHITSFLIVYGLSSISTIWYENSAIASTSMGLNLIAYLILILYLLPKVDLKKMNFLFTTLFIVLALINAYLLYELLVMIKDMTLSDAHYILMLCSTMAVVVLGFVALLYNHKMSSKKSLVFTVFIFVLIFSEVFRAIAYYDFGFGDMAVHIARILLIISLSLLVQYSFLLKNDNYQDLKKDIVT